MDAMSEAEIRDQLKVVLVAAMRDRHRRRVTTCRTALAALDNATAVPTTDQPAGQTNVGLAAAEVERRVVDENQARTIILAEAADLDAAAEHHSADAAVELAAEAAFLRGLAG